MVYNFPVCNSSNAHAQSPILATGMRFCPKLTHGLNFVCEQQRLWRDCAYAQARLSLLVAYVISTLFSCVGSYMAMSVSSNVSQTVSDLKILLRFLFSPDIEVMIISRQCRFRKHTHTHTHARKQASIFFLN